MKQRWKVRGGQSLRDALRDLGSEGPRLLDEALYDEATDIFNKSQRLVPVATGVLRGSGTVVGPIRHEVLIGYGGAAKSYAVHVHENLEARHAAPTRAKFLEEPFTAALSGLDDRLARALRGEFEQIAPGGRELIEYTTKAGTTRMASTAQVANWTRGARS